MMYHHSCSVGTAHVVKAWTPTEVRAAVRTLLDEQELPTSPHARIVIKPNLNNDLPALTGNSTDLRVLCALIEALKERGYEDITVADGPNVGVERRNIDVFSRLRIKALAPLYGVKLVDLNQDDGEPVTLDAGATPRIAHTLRNADYRISVPTIKTHAEMVLSSACKNWVGIACGQDKRHIHYSLAENIASLIDAVPPDLILVDGLVGMEGNGPGDGEPFRLGVLAAATNPWHCDVVTCRLIGLDWRQVPYLEVGESRGHVRAEWADEIALSIPNLHSIHLPPKRTKTAELAENRKLMWLKKIARPITDRPRINRLAYRLRIIQDVYDSRDDTIERLERHSSQCGDCTRCEDFCPTGLPLDDIGSLPQAETCIQCLYCWWVCPNDAIELTGSLNAITRPRARYKMRIEQI